MPGQWKEEWGGATLDSFVGVKPKMYSLHLAHYPKDQHEHDGVCGKQTAKGIPHNFKVKRFSHQAYINAIVEQSYEQVEYHRLQRKRMEINLIQESKVSLNSFNDKKFVLSTDKVNHSFGFNPL